MAPKERKLAASAKRRPAPAKALSSLPPAPAPEKRLGQPRGARLDSVRSVRREIARLYREARAKQLDVADASKLGNLLFLVGRLIEGQELEARISALEKTRVDAC